MSVSGDNDHQFDPPTDYADLLSGELFRDLPPEEAQRILDQTRPRHASVGETICRQGEPGESMFIVADGRVRVSVERAAGAEVVLNYLGRGHHFGELSMLVGTPRSATVTATMESLLLELERAEFHSLIRTVPGFGANLSRSLGTWLRRESLGEHPRVRPTVVAMIHSTPATAAVAPQLVRDTCQRGLTVFLLSDRPERWKPDAHLTLLPLPAQGWHAAEVGAIRSQLGQAVESGQRVLVDLSAKSLAEQRGVLSHCEQIWWVDQPEEYENSRAIVDELLQGERGLSARWSFIWLLSKVYPLAPVVEHKQQTAEPDMRLALDEKRGQYQLRLADLSRLVHRFEGFCLGLVLGGGGARGLAHIGALRAFEEAGIYFDRIAGTSIGALVGAMYAAGYEPDKILDVIGDAMTPPRWMRFVPGGRRWYLIATFRFGWAKQIILQQYTECSFEQLLIPMHTISVDLVSGTRIIRETGDAIGAILESFNIPGLAAPILRDGQALVDGGVLDNLPAGVLRERGADLVVAVDVAVKLAEKFAGNVPTTPLASMNSAGVAETLLRVLEVQQRGLAAVHTAAVDFAVEPDLSSFDFDDFSRGRAMADVGQAATETTVPRLKQILCEFQRAGSTSLPDC